MGSDKEAKEVPEILFVDVICKRYGWTFDEFDEQYYRHPGRIGELLTLLNAEGERMGRESRPNAKQENEARRRRLGVI